MSSPLSLRANELASNPYKSRPTCRTFLQQAIRPFLLTKRPPSYSSANMRISVAFGTLSLAAASAPAFAAPTAAYGEMSLRQDVPYVDLASLFRDGQQQQPAHRQAFSKEDRTLGGLRRQSMPGEFPKDDRALGSVRRQTMPGEFPKEDRALRGSWQLASRQTMPGEFPKEDR
ncbi:hypothetical protein FA95DRAFT_1008526 [Auriscalpium vulgare]|uniref:Uncharacterized protein n=1 Tax=Auriscalpium vulgare TaxID=40419 RepID=A0ACB8RY56_9AGAM|nr:hypothetical protein FA95DRAFT_1008526 [Auriscalpium vulgare]